MPALASLAGLAAAGEMMVLWLLSQPFSTSAACDVGDGGGGGELRGRHWARASHRTCRRLLGRYGASESAASGKCVEIGGGGKSSGGGGGGSCHNSGGTVCQQKSTGGTFSLNDRGTITVPTTPPSEASAGNGFVCFTMAKSECQPKQHFSL